MDHISAMQIPVCKVFASNGFQIEYMPDFLENHLPQTTEESEGSVDNYSPHIHSFYEILWFQEGKGKHFVDFMEYDVQPNTIFFMAPGQIHHFDHSTYKGVSIKICTDFLKSEECHCSLFLKYDVFHSFDSTPCFHIDDATATELKVLVSQMERESHVDKDASTFANGTKVELSTCAFGNAEMLQALMRMFLILVYRNGVKTGKLPLDEVKPSHQLFIRFRSLVEKEYQHNHSVQDYADELNTSVRTLNKCVNDCSGMSPLAFINSRVILEAKRLVRYTNLRIKEIAFALGYDDPSYFVRMFKRNTHYMPTEFREADNVI